MFEVNETPEAITLPNILNPEPTPEVTPARKRKPRAKAHKYIAVNRMERTVGIEVTFVPGGVDYEDKYEAERLCSPLSTILSRKLARAKVPYNRCGTDPECVEVSTKPMRTRNNMRRTLDVYYDCAEALGLAGYTEWHGGGGGHVHVGLKPGEKDQKGIFLQTLYADLSNRPYLTWAFMNPGDDNRNAAPVCTALNGAGQDTRAKIEGKEANVREYRAEMARQDRVHTPDKSYRAAVTRDYLRARKDLLALRKRLAEETKKGKDPHAEALRMIGGAYLGDNKHNAVTARSYGRYGTLEFRLFRAPGSPEGHELHVDFALAYIEYIEGLVRDGKMPMPCAMTKEQLRRAWTPEMAEKEFKKTLRLIGLLPSYYWQDVDNMKEFFRIQRDKYGAEAYTLPGETPATETPVETPAKPARVCRLRDYQLRDNIEQSRKRRAQRRERAARLRARAKLGIPAYLYGHEVMLDVGDVIRYGKPGSGIVKAAIDYQRGSGEWRYADDRGVYWTATGDKSDEEYTLFEVNGVTVIYLPEAELPPVMYPATLAECAGAYVDKEGGIVPGEYTLNVGDIVRMQDRSRATRWDMMQVTSVANGRAALTRAEGYDTPRAWNHCASCNPHTLIWDSGAWIVEVNGRPVQGRPYEGQPMQEVTPPQSSEPVRREDVLIRAGDTVVLGNGTVYTARPEADGMHVRFHIWNYVRGGLSNLSGNREDSEHAACDVVIWNGRRVIGR